VLALGPQQAGEAVALLLRAAAREDLVELVVATAFGVPDTPEVLDHVSHRGLEPLGGIILDSSVEGRGGRYLTVTKRLS
jgi:hypothetical protein